MLTRKNISLREFWGFFVCVFSSLKRKFKFNRNKGLLSIMCETKVNKKLENFYIVFIIKQRLCKIKNNKN